VRSRPRVGCAKEKDPEVEVPKVVVPKPAVEALNIVVDADELKWRNGLWHFEGKPFTGVAVQKGSNGQKKEEGTHKDGKANGMVTWWYENGQKSLEATYKDDEQISLKEWDRDGNRE
jgi:hypothetical protein